MKKQLVSLLLVGAMFGASGDALAAAAGCITAPISVIIRIRKLFSPILAAGVLALFATGSAADADPSIQVSTGWNLLGNTAVIAIDPAAKFGDPSRVNSVWTWDAEKSAWAFYSPLFATPDELSAYASGRGYQVLSAIAPGKGYWVNAAQPFSFAHASSAVYRLSASDLRQGWNLVATGESLTPEQLNTSLGGSAAAPSFSTMWSWDNADASWYFYSPTLAASNSLAAYIQSKSYLDFGNQRTGDGKGFWLNASPPPLSGSAPDGVPTLTFTGPTMAWPNTPPVYRQKVLQAQVASIAYDAKRDQLIAATALAPGRSALVGLDARTLDPLWSADTSSIATALAISDDGTFVYAGLWEGAIAQYDLSSHALVRSFSTNLQPCYGDGSYPIGTLKIAVQPGNPNIIVASIGRLDIVRPFCMAAAFDSGVLLPGTLRNGAGLGLGDAVPEIQFIDSNTLIGFDNSTTGPFLQRLSLSAGGLAADPLSRMDSVGYFDARLKWAAGRLFVEGSSRVMEIDPVSLRFLKAYGRGASPGIFHPGLNSVVEAHRNLTGTPVIELDIEEYDGSRAFLKRRFRISEPAVGHSTYSGFTGQFVEAVAVGSSRVAFLYVEPGAELRYLVLVDLAAVPEIQPRVFSVQAASAGAISALSLDLPVSGGTFNPATGLLVASVPALLGPQGNSLAQIDPSNGDIIGWIPLTSDPRTITIDQGGDIAYVTLPYEGAVQQVRLSSGTLGWKGTVFPSANPNNGVGRGVASVAIDPGDPNRIAIATNEDAYSTVYEIRNGELKNNPSQSVPYYGPGWSCNLLAADGPTGLVCAGLYTSLQTFARYSWTSSGIVAEPSKLAYLSGFDFNSRTRIGFGRIYDPFRISDVADLAVERVVPDIWSSEQVRSRSSDLELQSADQGVVYYSYYFNDVGRHIFAPLTLPGGGPVVLGERFYIKDQRSPVFVFGGRLIGLEKTRFAFALPPPGFGVIYIVSVP